MRMSFEDLPDDWEYHWLLDPTMTADVVDLFARHSDRLANTLLLLLTDRRGRLIQPVAISDMRWGCEEEERERAFDWLCHFSAPGTEEDEAIQGAVIAFCHRQPRIRASDLRWAETAQRRLGAMCIDLLGCYVAHSAGVRRIDLDEENVA